MPIRRNPAAAMAASQWPLAKTRSSSVRQCGGRAVFDALPFIMDADETEILVVDADEDADAETEAVGTEIAASLGRHGVHATVVNEKSAGLSVGTVIENHAAESKPDLMVMGAYSHSWLREFLFGGTTRTLLQSMPVPTFMSR